MNAPTRTLAGSITEYALNQRSGQGPRREQGPDYGFRAPHGPVRGQGALQDAARLMDAKRLRSGGGRSSGNPGSGVRQSAVVPRSFSYLRSQVMSLRPGYRVFVLCCGIGAGIVVIRGAGVFY